MTSAAGACKFEKCQRVKVILLDAPTPSCSNMAILQQIAYLYVPLVDVPMDCFRLALRVS